MLLRCGNDIVMRKLSFNNAAWDRFLTQLHIWVESVGSLHGTEGLFSGYAGFYLSLQTNIWFELICVNCSFQLTVSPISAPALERLDTSIKFLSFLKNLLQAVSSFGVN